jgi:hypothetical protein
MAFEDGSLLADYLYRNDIGIPEANRMNTDIDMNSNEINNVSRISGDPNIRLDTDVTIGQDLWALRDVNADGDVNADFDVTAGRNVIAGNSVAAVNDIAAGRNLSAGNNLTVGNLTTTNSLQVDTNANINGTTTTGLIDADNMNIDSVLQPATSGRSFNTAGLTLSDLLPKMVPQYSYQVTETNSRVYKPTCRGGYANARIMIYPKTISRRVVPNMVFDYTRSNGYVTNVYQRSDSRVDIAESMYAVNYDADEWQVVWSGESNPNVQRVAIAQTFCFYN